MTAEKLVYNSSIETIRSAPFSSPELTPEHLTLQSERLFRQVQKKLLGLKEFQTALRSTKDSKIKPGTFDFSVEFDGKDYEYKVSYEKTEVKKLEVERSFPFSYLGPTITEKVDLNVSQTDPLISYSWEVSDSMEESIREKNSQNAIKKIETFILM